MPIAVAVSMSIEAIPLYVQGGGGSGVVYITDIDEWNEFLDDNSISIDYEQDLYEEMGYADYDEFLAAIDEGSTVTEADVLAAWAIVQP